MQALYLALATVLHQFHDSKCAPAILLVFIRSKVIVADLPRRVKVPPARSPNIPFAILAAGVIYALRRSKGDAPVKRA